MQTEEQKELGRPGNEAILHCVRVYLACSVHVAPYSDAQQP